MSRTLKVVRMQLVNRQTFVWIPLIILSASLVMSILIWAMIPYGGTKYSGGGQAPLWYFFAVGIQSLTLTFPFSQAMSVTRRQFYLGTLLTAALTSVILAVLYVIGGLLEQATGGWGVNGYFFSFPWLWESGWAGALVIFFVMTMSFFVLGFWVATIYKRFGALWLTVVLVGFGLLLLGGVWLIGRLGAWMQVFQWFGTVGSLGLSLWGLLALVIVGGLTFLTLRRATP